MENGDGEEGALLDHPKRKAIYELVRSRPGINRNQVKTALGLAMGVLDFHLHRLENGKVIVRKPSHRDNEVLLFTPDQCGLWENPRTRLLFGTNATRKVAMVLAQQPGATSADIADAVEAEPVTVRYHLSKLRDHGLADARRYGNRVEYQPTAELVDWWEGPGRGYDSSWLTEVAHHGPPDREAGDRGPSAADANVPG